MADLKALGASGAAGDAAEQERVAALLAEAAHKETDPLVRAQAVRSLGGLRTATARTALAERLEDADRDVRLAACTAIAKSGGPDAVERLSQTLAGDSDLDVRMAAARGLGDLGDPAAVAGLGAALEDPDPAMQRRAVESLARVTGRSYGNDVNAWRAYVEGHEPTPRPVTLAERMRNLF
jgi:HEAT repeat protein